MIATVGTFDGVHRGHQFLLRKLVETAKLMGLRSAVVTFKNHPTEVLSANNTAKALLSASAKERLIRAAEVDEVLFFTFDESLRRMSSLQFARHLRDNYGVTAFLVGYNNRFGSDVELSFEQFEAGLITEGFKVVVVKDQLEKISSTSIRRLLERGDVSAAANLFGRLYSLEGRVVRGKGVGHTIGFPTANIEPIVANQLVPCGGVYATFATVDGTKFGAMVNIGHRPTVEGNALAPVTIEANIFDFNGDLYGKDVEISFVQRLRDEHHFDDISALRRQLQNDVASTRQILANYEKSTK